MAVVALPNIYPQGGSGPLAEWELKSLTAAFPGTLGASLKTLERPGARWAATFRFESLVEATRARMQAWLVSQRGQANRVYAPDYSRQTLRGSFPATELLTNNVFATGTTGWTGANGGVLSAQDGVLRVARSDSTASYGVSRSSIAVTANAPYCLRAIQLAGKGGSALSLFLSDGTITASAAPGAGLGNLVLTPAASTVGLSLFEATATGLAGDYFSIGYTSLARCALVDNAPNALLRSNDGGNASWTKSESTSGTNGSGSPSGDLTEQYIAETTNNTAHFITQAVTVSASVADHALSFYVKALNRSWCWVQMQEATGSTAVRAFLNLSTGAVGTTSTGANWSNLRTFVQPFGNSWYRIILVARKTNAATSVNGYLGSSTADGTTDFVGVTSPVALLWWRASLAQSSFPLRDSVTTTTASTGTSQTGGSLYLKGLPVSTAGLLLPGDTFDFQTSVGSEFKRVTAPLNSDAAGLGHLQFEQPIRNSPPDKAPVAVQRPLCRMLLDGNSVKWSEHSGGFCDLEFSCVEDVAA